MALDELPPATSRPSRPAKRCINKLLRALRANEPSQRSSSARHNKQLGVVRQLRKVASSHSGDNSDNLDPEHCACRVPQELSNAAIDRELDLTQQAALDVRGTAGVNDAAPSRQASSIDANTGGAAAQ